MFFKKNRQINELDQLIHRRDFETASTLLADLMQKSPKDATLLLQKAIIAFEQHDYDRALAASKEAVEQQPDNPIFHLAMGEVLYSQRECEDSIQALQKSLELSPDNPKAEYLLGLNQISLGHMERAAMHFEKVALEDRDFLFARLLTIGERWMQSQA